MVHPGSNFASLLIPLVLPTIVCWLHPQAASKKTAAISLSHLNTATSRERRRDAIFQETEKSSSGTSQLTILLAKMRSHVPNETITGKVHEVAMNKLN